MWCIYKEMPLTRGMQEATTVLYGTVCLIRTTIGEDCQIELDTYK